MAEEQIRERHRARRAVLRLGKAVADLGGDGYQRGADDDAALHAHGGIESVDQPVHGRVGLLAVGVPQRQHDGIMRIKQGLLPTAGKAGQSKDRSKQDGKHFLHFGRLLWDSTLWFFGFSPPFFEKRVGESENFLSFSHPFAQKVWGQIRKNKYNVRVDPPAGARADRLFLRYPIPIIAQSRE